MTNIAMSRRTLFGAGAGVLAVTAGAPETSSAQTSTGLSSRNEELIRRYYKTWEIKDWHPMDAILADDFTFSSAAPDDRISKATFKKECWETQIDHTRGFDLLKIYGSGDEAFVMYLGHTTNDKTFQNVEYLKLKDGRIGSIYCYFGGPANFPSAVSAAKS